MTYLISFQMILYRPYLVSRAIYDDISHFLKNGFVNSVSGASYNNIFHFFSNDFVYSVSGASYNNISHFFSNGLLKMKLFQLMKELHNC